MQYRFRAGHNRACCVHMCSRHPLYLVVFRASSHVQIFHLNVICSSACCVHMCSRHPLYLVVFRASSRVQMIPSEGVLLTGNFMPNGITWLENALKAGPWIRRGRLVMSSRFRTILPHAGKRSTHPSCWACPSQPYSAGNLRWKHSPIAAPPCQDGAALAVALLTPLRLGRLSRNHK